MYLYWIHLSDHTDPYTQGYIGITKNPERRFNQHRMSSQSHNPHVKEAVDNGTAIFTVLHEVSSLDEAYDLERKYRPRSNIGYNKHPGGNGGVGHSMSEEGRKNISEGRKGITVSEEGRANLRKNHPRRKRLVVDGVEYNSCADYTRATGRCIAWIKKMAEDPKHPNFAYK